MEQFKSFNSKESQETTLEKVFETIKNDEGLKNSTMLHRELLAQGQHEAAKKVKESTPQIAVSFRMEGGKGKENCRECLNNVLIDFDAKSPKERLPLEELERVITIMRTSYHTMLGYTSISGLGYHAIVPFRLPDDIVIDMENDPERSEKIFNRVHHLINNMFAVWCGHKMDADCGNINRMTGLSHDPLVVYRPDARPVYLTREELGIDADGNLIKMSTPKKITGKTGKHISIPLGDKLERAVKMIEDSGMSFEIGNRHNFITRVSFVLNRYGVDEEEAAQALDDAYLGKMDERPSKILHSCYKTASDEFGMWLQQKSSNAIKTEIVAEFIKKKSLKYDLLTQKTLLLQENGQWTEMKDRDENSLFMECCKSTDTNITLLLFRTVLNSDVVPAINILKEYVLAQAPWTPDMPDFIHQAASQVHMASEQENELWHHCFKKWFVAMVAGWTEEEVVNHQVIVLVGKQGIYKSTWIRRLLPPELKTYVSDMPDIQRIDKDEQLRAAEYGLINLDELDKLTDRELNKLKATVTAIDVNVRASFGHHKERRIRVASYAASGNKPEFLTDQTGNRRWLPFHVEHIDSPIENKLPYAGMYAQAYYLLKNGFNYWFDLKEIDALKEHVEQFMAPSPEEQLIQVYYSPIKKDEPGAAFLTLAEIAATLTTKGALKKEIDPRYLGAIMTKLGFVKDRNGRNRTRGYIVYEHSNTEINKIHDAKNL